MNLGKSILSVAALLAAALFLSTPAMAQTAVSADIPFAFEAGGKVFEPGTYTAAWTAHGQLVVLTSPEGRKVMMLANRGSHNKKGEVALAFNRTGANPSLAAVWFQPGVASYEIVGATKSRSGQRLEIAAR